MDMDFNWTHRSLLQVVLARGAVEKETARVILEEICEDFQVSPMNLEDVIKSINQEIRFLDHQIVIVDYDLTDKQYLFYKNCASPNINQLHFNYKKSEVLFIKRLLKELMQSETRTIKPTTAINLANSIKEKRPTTLQIENLLIKLCAELYLHKSDDVYHIGPRMLNEMQAIFLDKGVFANCLLCKSILSGGTSCPKCLTFFHKNCLRKYFRSSTNCPNCKLPSKML